jgi:hypothetical protein
LKHCFTLCTASLAFGLALSAAALAQPMPPAYPGPAIGVPPYEVVAIVRSAGLEPLHRPLRQGSGGYVLRALDPAGREVRVIVDGRSGRIIKVTPVPGAPQAQPLPPPVYGRPAGRIAVVPDGYGPSSRIPTSPYGLEGPPLYGPDMRLLPNAPGRPPGAGAPPHSAAPAAPPLPKPRPKVATSPATPPAAVTSPAAASPQPAAPKIEPSDGKKEANAVPAPPTASAAPGPAEFLE